MATIEICSLIQELQTSIHNLQTSINANLQATNQFPPPTTTPDIYSLPFPQPPPIAPAPHPTACFPIPQTPPNSSLSHLPIRRLSPAKIEELNDHGLCYNCEQIWSNTHRCRSKYLILLGTDGEDEFDDVKSPDLRAEVEIIVEDWSNSGTLLESPLPLMPSTETPHSLPSLPTPSFNHPSPTPITSITSQTQQPSPLYAPVTKSNSEISQLTPPPGIHSLMPPSSSTKIDGKREQMLSYALQDVGDVTHVGMIANLHAFSSSSTSQLLQVAGYLRGYQFQVLAIIFDGLVTLCGEPPPETHELLYKPLSARISQIVECLCGQLNWRMSPFCLYGGTNSVSQKACMVSVVEPHRMAKEMPQCINMVIGSQFQCLYDLCGRRYLILLSTLFMCGNRIIVLDRCHGQQVMLGGEPPSEKSWDPELLKMLFDRNDRINALSNDTFVMILSLLMPKEAAITNILSRWYLWTNVGGLDFDELYQHVSKGSWTFSMQVHGWSESYF